MIDSVRPDLLEHQTAAQTASLESDFQYESPVKPGHKARALGHQNG